LFGWLRGWWRCGRLVSFRRRGRFAKRERIHLIELRDLIGAQA
jgi:hypothetical protein